MILSSTSAYNSDFRMEEDSPDIDLTSDESDFALDEFEDDVSSSEEVEGESQSEVELDPDLRHANPWVRTYSPEDRPNPDHEFDEDCGPRGAPPPDAKPLDYILLFLTLDFLASVVTHTNNNATAFIDNNRANIRPKSIVHKWAVCSDRKQPGGRKRARTACNKCHKGLHGTCIDKHKCKNQ